MIEGVSGTFHRYISLDAPRSGRVDAEVRDEFHHFRVHLDHDGATVTDVEAESVRFPWSTCPGAAAPLRRVVGARLSPSPSAIGRHARARDNCTHMFDLCGLAMAHAAAGRRRRDYRASVPDPVEGRTVATLERDGEVVLRWELNDLRIVAPPPFAGRGISGGFIEFAENGFDSDGAEAALVLRRAVFVSIGRRENLKSIVVAGEMLPTMAGSCYTFTPGIAEHGRHIDSRVELS